MVALQKLRRNGNATSVSIPRPMMMHLGWFTGKAIIVELLEDRTIRLRPPTPTDFGFTETLGVIHTSAPQATK